MSILKTALNHIIYYNEISGNIKNKEIFLILPEKMNPT